MARLRPEGWDEIFQTQYFRLRQEQMSRNGKRLGLFSCWEEASEAGRYRGRE